MINGYGSNKARYERNNRVRSGEVVLDGKHRFTVTFKDGELEHQWFGVPHPFKTFRFIIKSVYPGTDTRDNDTCLQWLRFE